MAQSIIIYSLFIFASLFSCALFSYKFNLVDIPSDRKIHTKPTAFTGGIAISLSYLFALQLFDVLDHSLNSIVSLSFLITIVGLIDDKYHLNTGGKLCLQIIPIFYLIVFENLILIHIGDYDQFKLVLASFSLPFTLLSVLFLINAFNYFDGLDGSLSFTFLTVIAILYFLASDNDTKLFLITILLPIIFFIFFNFSIFKLPKLFLGDNGSLLFGFIISFILIYYAENGIAHPILLAWSISIFVYEFLSVNLQRVQNKKNPFTAGLDHLHHHLLNKTNSILFTNICLCSINFLFFIVGYLTFLFFGPFASLITFVIAFITFFILRYRIFVK